jgi:hypothetical protein
MLFFKLYLFMIISTLCLGQTIYAVEYSDSLCQSPLFYYYFNNNQCDLSYVGNPACSSREACSGEDYNTFSLCAGFSQSGSFYNTINGNTMVEQIYTTNDCTGTPLTQNLILNQCSPLSYSCGASYQLTTIPPSVSCVDLKDFDCVKQHEDKIGPCLSVTIMNTKLLNNKTIKATHDHLILIDNSWKLFRELQMGFKYKDNVVINVSNDICFHLNSCVSGDFKFDYMNEIFGTMSLITPDDLYKIPAWMYKMLKLFVNLPL